MDNGSSEDQKSGFKHQHLLQLHNLKQTRSLLCGVQMGITVFRSDIKADKVFLQLPKPALRHLGFPT